MASSRAASAEARAQCDVNCRRFSAGHIALRSASAVEFVEPSSSSFASSSSSSPFSSPGRSRSSTLQRLKRALFRLRTVAPMESTEKQRKEEEEQEKEQETPFVNRRKRKLLAPQPVCPHGNPCRKSQSGGGSGRISPDSGYDATEPSREAWAEKNDMSGGRCETPLGPLHLAAVEGNVRMLRQLLASHAVFVDLPDAEGLTPLMFALLAGHTKCADVLRRLGAQLDAADKHGRTALHFVAFNGGFRALRWLLSRGADWRLRDHSNRTVLHYACDHASPRCLQLLLKRVPLSMLDDIDDQGMTPLLWAAHHGHVSHSRLLLARGATPAAIDVQGRSALHFAATQSDAVFVRWLAAAWPASIGAEDAEGRTPLHMACMFGAFDVAVALLAEMDAMVSCSSARWLPALRDACGRTPLHCAAVVGHTPLVRELVRRGHTPRVVDADGYDPEYYARLQGHQLAAEALAHASSVVGCLPLDNRAVAMCH